MKCPHCLVAIHPDWKPLGTLKDYAAIVHLQHLVCPACLRLVVWLQSSGGLDYGNGTCELTIVDSSHILWPRRSGRPPAPPEVPKPIAEDFDEAGLILELSPKASAALSRRCLQAILHEAGKFDDRNLNDQIDKAIKSTSLPSAIGDGLHALRELGNFAAHPIPSQASGTITPVEPHEAEWALDVIESLFDFYYVQPAKLLQRRAAISAKLQSAGKPPLK